MVVFLDIQSTLSPKVNMNHIDPIIAQALQAFAPPSTDSSLIPLIDELGAIDAQIKALTKTSDALKASLKALGEGEYIGTSYKCLVYGSKGRDITDWKTIAEQFNPSYQLITAHTKKGEPSLTAKPSKI